MATSDDAFDSELAAAMERADRSLGRTSTPYSDPGPRPQSPAPAPDEAGHLTRDNSADDLGAVEKALMYATGNSNAVEMLRKRKSDRDFWEGKRDSERVDLGDGKSISLGALRQMDRTVDKATRAAGGAAVGLGAAGLAAGIPGVASAMGPIQASTIPAMAGATAAQVTSDAMDPNVRAADMPLRAGKAAVIGGGTTAALGVANAAMKPLADKLVVPNESNGEYDWLPADKRPPAGPAVNAEATYDKFDKAASKVATIAGVGGAASGGLAAGAGAAVGTKVAARALAEYAVAVSEGKATDSMVKGLLAMGFPQTTMDSVAKTAKPVKVGDE